LKDCLHSLWIRKDIQGNNSPIKHKKKHLKECDKKNTPEIAKNSFPQINKIIIIISLTLETHLRSLLISEIHKIHTKISDNSNKMKYISHLLLATIGILTKDCFLVVIPIRFRFLRIKKPSRRKLNHLLLWVRVSKNLKKKISK